MGNHYVTLLPIVLCKGKQKKELHTNERKKEKFPSSKLKEQHLSANFDGGSRELNNTWWGKRWTENGRFTNEFFLTRGRKEGGVLQH